MNSKTTKSELLKIITLKDERIKQLEQTVTDLTKKLTVKKDVFCVLGIRKFTTEAFTQEAFAKWVRQSTPIASSAEMFEDFEGQELVRERMWYKMADGDFMLVESTHRNEPTARIHRIVTFYANGIHQNLEAVK